MRAQYLADPAAYADRFRLTAQQRGALLALDNSAIAALGAHPLVAFLARMQIERQRRSSAFALYRLATRPLTLCTAIGRARP